MALRSFLDGALFAEVYGSEPPKVLALHGWGRRGSDFSAALEGIPAIAPDLPGFGASPVPKEVLGADAYADILVEMLEDFDRPPVLVGHSFGGRVAVCLAARYPEMTGSLVLTGVPLIRFTGGRRPALRYRAMRKLNSLGVVSDDRMEKMRRRKGSSDYRAAEGVMRDILVKVVNESYESQLSRIEKPVHLLWGENDTDVPPRIAEAAHALLVDSTLEIVPDVGHFLPTQRPELLRNAVEQALV